MPVKYARGQSNTPEVSQIHQRPVKNARLVIHYTVHTIGKKIRQRQSNTVDMLLCFYAFWNLGLL